MVLTMLFLNLDHWVGMVLPILEISNRQLPHSILTKILGKVSIAIL